MLTEAMAVLLLLGAPGAAVGAEAELRARADRPAAAAADTADDIDAAVARDETKLKFDFQPYSIQLNSYLHFDDDGNTRSEQHNCSLSVHVRYEPSISPVGYSDLKLTQIVTDTGEKLEPRSGASSSDFSHRGRQQEPKFQIGLTLPAPPPHARALLEVSGTMTVHIADGPMREATLGPYAKILNKRIRIEGLEDPVLALVSSEEENKRVKIQYSMDARQLMSEIRLTDARGVALPSNSWGSGSDGQMAYRYYRLTMPDDGRIVISFFSRVRKVDVPFTIRNVPLPRPKRQGAADLVVQAVPEGQKAPAAAPAEPQVEPLKVIIE